MKIKVCGITQLDQLQQLAAMGIDFAGLIFFEGSKRFAAEKLKVHASAIRQLQMQKIGVFVNADLDTIKNAVNEFGLNMAQLHGDESPEFCLQVKEIIPVIKAIRIGDRLPLQPVLNEYEGACDYFLFDTGTATSQTGDASDKKEKVLYGGTGKKFEWKMLEEVKIHKPFFLSGGIGLDDVEAVNAFQHPMLFAIDVNSRFETSPGVKELNQVKFFKINIL